MLESLSSSLQTLIKCLYRLGSLALVGNQILEKVNYEFQTMEKASGNHSSIFPQMPWQATDKEKGV